MICNPFLFFVNNALVTTDPSLKINLDLPREALKIKGQKIQKANVHHLLGLLK
jgi:hypothetical protein